MQSIFIETFLTPQLTLAVFTLVTETHKATYIAPMGINPACVLMEVTHPPLLSHTPPPPPHNTSTPSVIEKFDFRADDASEVQHTQAQVRSARFDGGQGQNMTVLIVFRRAELEKRRRWMSLARDAD
ncbi:hypothetical protein BKA66DRAFT_438455 [Pyrenochaeta sp. MPI-SDFR-AT-0127]|nr:hypothetical protein BKA66DRAFT_438455 [Pyrenochaeta sp. MPI-SDFR-AT-0127]